MTGYLEYNNEEYVKIKVMNKEDYLYSDGTSVDSFDEISWFKVKPIK